MDPDDFFLLYLLVTVVLSASAFLILVRVYPVGESRRTKRRQFPRPRKSLF